MNSTQQENSPIIIELGSSEVRVGLAGTQDPSIVIPSYVGVRKDINSGIMNLGETLPEYIFGSDVRYRQTSHQIRFPVQASRIEDWDLVEKMLDYVLGDQMGLSLESHPIMMLETPYNPPQYKEQLGKFIFDNFKPNKFCLKQDPAGALMGSGMLTGTVAMCGDYLSYATAIYEGYNFHKETKGYLHYGGQDITEYLSKLLQSKLNTYYGRFLNTDLKEQFGYISEDYEDELKKHPSEVEALYILPDGIELKMDKERYEAPETIFQPMISGKSLPGIDSFVYKTINEGDLSVFEAMYGNIMLAGGTTLFPGFSQRMKKQLTHLAPSEVGVNVIAPDNRRHIAWKGASLLASMSQDNGIWIKKSEYEESGESIINTKCP